MLAVSSLPAESLLVLYLFVYVGFCCFFLTDYIRLDDKDQQPLRWADGGAGTFQHTENKLQRGKKEIDIEVRVEMCKAEPN